MVVLSATVGFNARPADVTTGPLDATLYDMLYGYLPIFLARKLTIVGNTVQLQGAPTDPTGLGVQGRWKVNIVTISVNVPLGTPGTVYIFADLSNTAVKGFVLVASVTNTPAAYQQLLGTVTVAAGAVTAGSLSLAGNVPVDPNAINAAGDWRLTQGAASPVRSVYAGAVTDTLVAQAGAIGLGAAPGVGASRLVVSGAPAGANSEVISVMGTVQPAAGSTFAIGMYVGANVDTTLGVVPNWYGIYLNPAVRSGANAVTVATALAVNAPTAGATNFAASFAGNVTFDTNGRLQQEAWTAVLGGVGFKNSWVNYGGGNAVAQFMRDSQGFVHLRGAITSGTLTNAAFTLPVGYRPVSTEGFPATSAAGTAFAGVVVTPAGDVQIYGGSIGPWSLSGITFATN